MGRHAFATPARHISLNQSGGDCYGDHGEKCGLVGTRLLQPERHCGAEHQGGQAPAEVEPVVLHALRGECRPAPASRADLQPRELPAHGRDARGDRDVAADFAARAAGQDRNAAGSTCPLRHVPVCRGGAAARYLREHPRSAQPPARAAGSSGERITETDPKSAAGDAGGRQVPPEHTDITPVDENWCVLGLQCAFPKAHNGEMRLTPASACSTVPKGNSNGKSRVKPVEVQ